MLTIVKGFEGLALLAALSFYLAPSILADANERDDALAITLVNVLLGWTVIGWIAAFVWAHRPASDRPIAQVVARRRQAWARTTIAKLVAHAKGGVALTGGLARNPLSHQPVPVTVNAGREHARQK
ncbi:T4 superinfection immunity protein [Trinickia symbiotica]|uniref:superinfection immunity protein n=1 Tax=Trinickia symbiotica TaxID=863227 RepID=UPI00035C3C65|nr:superinfection immunity protein [Trinickia symbiotica]PPK47217.1 T4 superinfection immunity protein [Trinickia symbiotica]